MVADGMHFDLDAGRLSADEDRLIRQYLTAGTRTIATTTKELERKLEAATRAAVPGRLWRAWASKVSPDRIGPARDPAGRVFLNGKTRTRGAMQFWTEPGSIRGRSGQYLAIPLPAAGPRGRDRDLSPGEWERATGQRLRFLYRQGKPSLLVAIGTTNGRSGVFRPLTPGKNGRIAKGRAGPNPAETAVIPIFILIRVVQHRNAFAVAPIVAESQAEIAPNFVNEIRSLPRG